jgi:antitoxin ParD1/3/4
MSSITLNVRVNGVLGDFVAANVGDAGSYENVSEYVRDLIRRLNSVLRLLHLTTVITR